MCSQPHCTSESIGERAEGASDVPVGRQPGGVSITRLARLGGALLLAPLLGAWQGSGESSGAYDAWTAATGDPVSARQSVAFDAVGRVNNGSTDLVLVFDLPGTKGDGVLTLRFDWDVSTGAPYTLPGPMVEVTYEEYSAKGETVFFTHSASGTLESHFSSDGAFYAVLNLHCVAADQSYRDLVNLAVDLEPDTNAPAPADNSTGETQPAGGSVTASNGGCEDNSYESSSADDSSWNADSSAANDSGGCDGSSDTSTDTGETSSDSGCAGDDVSSDTSSSSSGCGDSCQGDAAAALSRAPLAPHPGAPGRVRHLFLAKLVSWLPYWVVLVPLGLRNRRHKALRGSLR